MMDTAALLRRNSGRPWSLSEGHLGWDLSLSTQQPLISPGDSGRGVSGARGGVGVRFWKDGGVVGWVFSRGYGVALHPFVKRDGLEERAHQADF